MHKKNFTIIHLFLGTLVCLPLQSQAQNAVMADIAPCMNLAETSARHACYDQLEIEVRAALSRTRETTLNVIPAAAPVEQQAAPAETPTEAPASEIADAAPVTVQPVESFGRQTPAEAAKVITNPEGETELRDTIASMQEREPKRWLFTLASGQVWYQVNSQRVNLKQGDEVRIFASRFGNSWRIGRADGKEVGFVQVRRVQ